MSKKEQAKELLELIPEPSTKDIERIAKKADCSTRTVYRALEEMNVSGDSQPESSPVRSKKNNYSSTSPPPSSIPNYEHENIKNLVMNFCIHALKHNTRAATKALDVLTREEFIEQGEIVNNVYWTSTTPPYKRPSFLYPHQVKAMSLMEISHLLWQASRQLAGKTTATFLKDFEDMLETPNTLVALVAPTVPLAVEVLFKFLYDPLKKAPGQPRFYDILKPYFLKEPNQLGFTLKNGSRLQIISLNVAGSQGRSIDIIHIEEIDKLGTEQSKRLALAGIINSLRANPEAKVRINCNNATGIFRLLKQELYPFGIFFPIYLEDVFFPGQPYSGKHTVINEEVVPEKEPALDDILRIFSEVLVSFAFAEGQLYNIDNVTDETFNPDKVEYAYTRGKTLETPIYKRTTMGVDPGGKVDAFGVSVWSFTKSGDVVLRWCKRYFNATHTAAQVAQEMAEVYIRFNVEYCEVESSAGSPWNMSLVQDEVFKQSQGKIIFRFEYVNFEGEGQPFDKGNFVYMFKILLDYEKLVLFERNDEERVLHHQIIKYIPNKSESNNNPDDLVESGFHGIWILIGGMKYIKELIEQAETPIGVTI